MAERRMFSKSVIDSDAFIDMPLTTQALYFHLGMAADDDGFLNNARKIQRMLGCSDDDMRILLTKKFIIPFDEGVCVIRHWKTHNLIQKDRYKPTLNLVQKEKLLLNNNVYDLDTDCIQNESALEPQVRLGKDRVVDIKLADMREIDDRGVRSVTRATRLPSDCEITEQWINEALRIRPDWNKQTVLYVFESFKDYWVAKSGRDATKMSWIATWRNWCKNEKTTVLKPKQGGLAL